MDAGNQTLIRSPYPLQPANSAYPVAVLHADILPRILGPALPDFACATSDPHHRSLRDAAAHVPQAPPKSNDFNGTVPAEPFYLYRRKDIPPITL